MAIAIRCGCGKDLVVKEELAGKRVRCPHCKEILTIADPRAPGEHKAAASRTPGIAGNPASTTPKAPAGTKPGPSDGKCPACTQPWSPGAVLCVHCGFDLRTGKRVGTRQPAPTPGKVRRCLHCNAEIDENSPLCGTCGKALGSKPRRRASEIPSKPSRDWLLFGIAYLVTLVLVFVMFPLNVYLFWKPAAAVLSVVIVWISAVLVAVNWTFRMFGEDMPDLQQGLATVTVVPATVMFFGALFMSPCLLVIFAPLFVASVAKEVGYLVDMGFARGILIVVVYNVLAVALTGIGVLVVPLALVVFSGLPSTP